jgi:hypothetical protein
MASDHIRPEPAVEPSWPIGRGISAVYDDTGRGIYEGEQNPFIFFSP